MRQRRAMDIAHRNGGDQIAVEQSRAGQRQVVAADYRALRRRRDAAGKTEHLPGFFAVMPGKRAGQRIQQHVLAVLTHRRRNVVVFQRSRKAGEMFSGRFRHRFLRKGLANLFVDPGTHSLRRPDSLHHHNSGVIEPPFIRFLESATASALLANLLRMRARIDARHLSHYYAPSNIMAMWK